MVKGHQLEAMTGYVHVVTLTGQAPAPAWDAGSLECLGSALRATCCDLLRLPLDVVLVVVVASFTAYHFEWICMDL